MQIVTVSTDTPKELRDGHGAHGHDAHAKGDASPWQDPILIVGMAGVASLLLAAFVALVKR